MKQFKNSICYGINLTYGHDFEAWKQQIEKNFRFIALQLQEGQNIIIRAPTLEELNKYGDLYTNPKKLNNKVQHFYGFQNNTQHQINAIQWIQKLIDKIKPMAKQILRITGYAVIPNHSTINWTQYHQLMNNNNDNKKKHSDKEEMDQDIDSNNHNIDNEPQQKINNKKNNNTSNDQMLMMDDTNDDDQDDMSISDEESNNNYQNANNDQNQQLTSVSPRQTSNNKICTDFNSQCNTITMHLCKLINATYDGSKHAPEGTLFGLLRSC